MHSLCELLAQAARSPLMLNQKVRESMMQLWVKCAVDSGFLRWVSLLLYFKCSVTFAESVSWKCCIVYILKRSKMLHSAQSSTHYQWPMPSGALEVVLFPVSNLGNHWFSSQICLVDGKLKPKHVAHGLSVWKDMRVNGKSQRERLKGRAGQTVKEL